MLAIKANPLCQTLNSFFAGSVTQCRKAGLEFCSPRRRRRHGAAFFERDVHENGGSIRKGYQPTKEGSFVGS